jgi:hypothetical protein
MCQFSLFPLIQILLALVFFGQQIIAFSSMNFRREIAFANTITHHRPINSYLSAESNTGGQFFQDDDCEDLCDAFSDEAPMPSLANSMKETVPPQNRSVPPMRLIKRTLWSDPKPTKCKSCSGDGSTTCRFCGGVSFLSGIGGETDALFFDGIGKSCPVCDDGNEICRQCSGTGYVFSWKRPSDDNDSMRP